MSRRKKPENETAEEATVRRLKETVANHADRSMKLSWDRQMSNMVSLLAKLTPIEEQLGELMAQRNDLLDAVTKLRQDMIRSCVHPFTHLVHHEDHIVCKFCDKKFRVNR